MEQEQSRVDGQRPATGPREIIILSLVALALVLGVAGVIIYGYRTKPGWVGITGKTFWDYLDLLFVPAVLAIGATIGASWLNLQQWKRQNAAEKDQAKAAEDAETQRAQSDALQAYITEVGSLITEYSELSTEGPELEGRDAEAESNYQKALSEYQKRQKEFQEKVEPKMNQGMVDDSGMVDVGGGRRVNAEYYKGLVQEAARHAENLRRERVSIEQQARLSQTRYIVRRSVIRAQTLTALERVGEQRKRAIMRLLSEAKVVQVEVGTDEERIIQLHDADFSGADLTYMHLAQNSLQSIRFTKANLAGTNLTDANLSNADLSDADLSNANLTNARVTQDQLAKCKSLSGVTLPDGSKHP